MSVDLYVVMLRDGESSHHQAMVKAMNACKEAGICMPAEIEVYFEGTHNEDEPLKLHHHDCESKGIIREYSSEYESGYEIDVTNIPEGVVTIRAVLS